MNQNIFCSKCHRIPSQCCCTSAKTLTDEEIKDFTVRIYNCRTGAEAHEIVLAILRKAQEEWLRTIRKTGY
jgi:hypothetical protein